jgi:hypothetical protein
MVYDKAKWHSDGNFPKGLPYDMDGVLSDEDLSKDGNAFAAHYYKDYMGEYDQLIRKRLATAYHATDDWLTYDMVAAMIDKRHAQFRSRGGNPEVE